MAKAPSQRKLDTLRREWQKRLKLQDWHITATFVTRDEIPDRDVANCLSQAESRRAEIKLANPNELDPNDEREQDYEDSLVHELLHCHFKPFMAEDGAMAIFQEQVIETLAGALLGLKRGNGRK